jgi:hypothetical protein
VIGREPVLSAWYGRKPKSCYIIYIIYFVWHINISMHCYEYGTWCILSKTHFFTFTAKLHNILTKMTFFYFFVRRKSASFSFKRSNMDQRHQFARHTLNITINSNFYSHLVIFSSTLAPSIIIYQPLITNINTVGFWGFWLIFGSI